MTAATPRTVHACDLPEGSTLRAVLPGAHYADAYQTNDPAPASSALQAWLDVTARTPRWTQGLMALRNRLVRLVGLKDLGQLGDLDNRPHPHDAANYRVGDRVGIFEIRHLGEREVVMGQNDKHLNVQVSLSKQECAGRPVLTLSTVVHIHNTLGHAYMAVVTPFHRAIVPAMLRRFPDAPQTPQQR